MTTAIILAGGLGTRLRSEVPNLPKPMAPISGRPFLEHQMDFWIRQGITDFILSVGYKKEVIIEHFGYSYNGATVRYAPEDTPLGTGGGLLLALGLVNDKQQPVLILNGDTYFEVDLETLKANHIQARSHWSFSLFRANEVGRYMGMDIDNTNRITSLQSGCENIGRLANGGVYLVSPDIADSLTYEPGDKLSLEDDLLSELFKNNVPIHGFEFKGHFIDIGIPFDYQRAAKVMKI